MSEREVPEKNFRKAIREGLSGGGLGILITSGTFKVYDDGKNAVVYKGDKMIDIQGRDVYSSLNSRKPPKNVPSDK